MELFEQVGVLLNTETIALWLLCTGCVLLGYAAGRRDRSAERRAWLAEMGGYINDLKLLLIGDDHGLNEDMWILKVAQCLERAGKTWAHLWDAEMETTRSGRKRSRSATRAVHSRSGSSASSHLLHRDATTDLKS